VNGLLLAASLLLSPARAGSPPAEGSPAPDFRLASQDGEWVSPRDFLGQWIVLYFYPKDFTKGCTIEARAFQKDLKKYRKKKAVVLGVSVQKPASHAEFCQKEGLGFKLLADIDQKASSAYGSLGDNGLSTRNTFLIDPSGVVRKAFLNVAPAKHSAEVLAALSALKKTTH
jgi:thioredoxin-dependent peroxiredoxin